mmetsp:Transcript_25193/g.60599  ORF Transcript_25193/g.60599 Transcript_25193/m.60599 type:complete len:107 (+) Transcript_25193:505-825(+)
MVRKSATGSDGNGWRWNDNVSGYAYGLCETRYRQESMNTSYSGCLRESAVCIVACCDCMMRAWHHHVGDDGDAGDAVARILRMMMNCTMKRSKTETERTLTGISGA